MLTWLRVGGRLLFSSSFGIFLKCRWSSRCSADSRWLEGHIPLSPGASLSRCLKNTAGEYYGNCCMACCNPCSAQTARMWRLIHGSPKSLHNEAFLSKERKTTMKRIYLMHVFSTVPQIQYVDIAYGIRKIHIWYLYFHLFFQPSLPCRFLYTWICLYLPFCKNLTRK